ncbi:MAG: hypothetical protein IJR36_09330 [Lachnospiraceae bacterium]|nr:hypothetical protein [Lachnospiraceae bacterium]
MAIYFVDYENVGSAGVDGVDYLTDQDEIKIFYSNHADTLKYEQVKQLLSTKAKVDLLKIETGTANALDFQLVAMLYYTLKDDEPRYIISRDTGYDMAVKMGEQLGASGVVKRCISVKKALNDRARSEQAARKAEARAEEPEKAEPEKTEVKKDAPKRTVRRDEPKKEMPRREEPEKAEPREAAPAAAEPEKAEAEKPAPKNEPARKHAKHEPVKAEALTREPVRYEPVKAVRDETGTVKAEKAAPVKEAKAEPAAETKAEPAKEAPKAAEPAKPAKKPAFEIRTSEGRGKASASGILEGYSFGEQPAAETKSVLGAGARSVLGQGPKIMVKTMEGGRQIGEATERKVAEKPAAKEHEPKPEKAKEVRREPEKSREVQAEPETVKETAPESVSESAAPERTPEERPRRERSSRRRERSGGDKPERKQDEEYLKKLRYIADDVQRHTGMRLNSSQCEMVLEALKASEGKDDFYHYFQQVLGNKKGQVFYQQIRSRFKHLKDKLAPWQPPVMPEPAGAEAEEEPAPALAQESVSEEAPEVEAPAEEAAEVTEEPAAEEPEEAPAAEEPAEAEEPDEDLPAAEAAAEDNTAPVRAEEAQEKPVHTNGSETPARDNSILGRLGRLLGR